MSLYIFLDLIPNEIEIGSTLGVVHHTISNKEIAYEKWISLKGAPLLDSDKYKKLLDLTDGKTEIAFPDEFSIRIAEITPNPEIAGNNSSGICDTRNNVGLFHYLKAIDGDFENPSEPASFHATIEVSKDYFNEIATLIQSREANITATIRFAGISADKAISTDISGLFSSWNIGISNTLSIEDFYIHATYTRNANSLNRLLKKKLSILENEIKELKNKKMSIF